MKILVDADACSVIDKIENIARSMDVKVILFCDTSRILNSDYSDIVYVGTGMDAVDFAILNHCNKGDVVVTNDGGLASLVLAKKGRVLNRFGREIKDRDVDSILMSRHIRKQAKRKGSNMVKFGYSSKYEHTDFKESLTRMLA